MERWGSSEAEVGLLQGEVRYVDAVVAVEICPLVVAWVADGLAEGGLEDREVDGVDHVVVVGVPYPHQTHLDVHLRSTRERYLPGVRKVFGAFDTPVISAGGQAGNCDR